MKIIISHQITPLIALHVKRLANNSRFLRNAHLSHVSIIHDRFTRDLKQSKPRSRKKEMRHGDRAQKVLDVEKIDAVTGTKVRVI